MSLFDSLRTNIEQENAFSLATVVAGPRFVGAKAVIHPDGRLEAESVPEALREPMVSDALELLQSESSDTRTYELSDGAYEVFFDSHIPPPRLIIIGAVQIGQALCRLAKQLGFKVIVTDARAAFATKERFPEADEVLKGWPQEVLPTLRFDESTYVVLLSHDPKFDEPTLRHVLPLAVRYIGAIGSRRTQAARRERLLAEGFDEQVLDKIHGPVGLDLGGQSAEETALAILAEIVAVRHGKAGGMIGRHPQPVVTP